MCGIVGVHNLPHAAQVAEQALEALTNRGQDATGIAIHNPDEQNFSFVGGEGTPEKVYTPAQLASFAGRVALGENRWTTNGDTGLVQPTQENDSTLTMVHNGNLSHTFRLDSALESLGVDLTDNPNDTERASRYLANRVKSGDSLEEAMAHLFSLIADAGSFCIIAADQTGKMVAMRDPFGFRPLSVGRKAGGFIVASETNALQRAGIVCEPNDPAAEWRDVQPGEMLIFDDTGMRSALLARGQHALCATEFIYLAHPESILYGRRVKDIRYDMGRQLAIEQPPTEDGIVIPVPQTAIPFARGFADQSGLPLEENALYIAKEAKGIRSFMEASPGARQQAVRKKLRVHPGSVEGEVAYVVDDSIFRGNVQTHNIKLLRENNAKRIHARIGSPPAIEPNNLGVATRMPEELISHDRTTEEVRKIIDADSLGHLSVEGMFLAINPPEGYGLSTPDFTGDNPIRRLHQLWPERQPALTRTLR